MIELARNFFDEMEADSRRFLETPPVFAGVIRVKHPLDILRGNADTVIFDFKHRPVFIAEDIQLQSVTLACRIFDRICNHLADRKFEPFGIGVNLMIIANVHFRINAVLNKKSFIALNDRLEKL